MRKTSRGIRKRWSGLRNPVSLAAALFAALLLVTSPRAGAKDAVVQLTLDGRPISKKPVIALMHEGALFVDVVDLTRVFNGLLVFERGGVRITVHGHTASFFVGRRTAQIDKAQVHLPGAPFEYAGDVFIPMATVLAADKAISLAWLSPHHADLHLTVFSSAS